MNAMMKRFWVPACLSEDIASRDSDPYRFSLLGESYVAFRDSNGRVGILDEACCHRGASLALGRVEDCGIRCLYHGWKFSVDGTIQETPNLRDPKFRQKFKAPAYPALEVGGIVWAYFGPPKSAPPFPKGLFKFTNDLAPEHVAIVRVKVACNWLQMLEGGIDSSHLGILHADSAPLGESDGNLYWDPPNRTALRGPTFDSFLESSGLKGNGERISFADNAPVLEVENTDFGFHYAAIRKPTSGLDSETEMYVRVMAFIMPMTAVIGSFEVFYVPEDDTHTSWIMVYSDPAAPVHRDQVLTSFGLDRPGVLVNEVAQFFPENRWQQDRSRLNVSFSGLEGFGPEDAAVAMSQGLTANRTKEHLVPADIAIIRARRQLVDSVRAVSNGGDPTGLLPGRSEAVESGEGILKVGTPWQTLVPGNVSDPGVPTKR
jgi:phenylpropionate dioxygenase-like ring-hydroxylating dioxygenase large terminal subunit